MTNVEPDRLWGHFLHSLPEGKRQHYNCHACRKFIQAHGGAVKVHPDGKLGAFLFDMDGVPEFFKGAVDACREIVEGAQLVGVHRWTETVWGTPQTNTKGVWNHLGGPVLKSHKDPLRTASQQTAELLEDYGVLCRSFEDYGSEVVEEALRVLKADVLGRSEKAVGIAQWYLDVLNVRRNKNLVWLLVATAPKGFAHVKNTVVATLFDDVKAGVPFAEASRKWSEKMHPLQYQRPTREVGEGAIKAAEAIVEKLGLARSFERRFAMLSDIEEFVWRRGAPVDVAKVDEGGLFSHLKAKQAPAVKRMELPAKRVDWPTLRPLLAAAKDVEVLLPVSGNYCGLVTAVHADAPVLFQWPNPVSWYVYMGGSYHTKWGLPLAGWTPVAGVFEAPHRWKGLRLPNHVNSLVFAISGAIDKSPDNLCLFPETLKSDLHGIRAVVEANNRSQRIQGETSEVCGLMHGGSSGGPATTLRLDGMLFELSGPV